METKETGLASWWKTVWSDLRAMGTERLVGEKLLNYVGMVLLVLGGAFFLKYTANMYGPMMKVALGAISGMGLVAFGESLRRQRRFSLFSVPVIGGGWILLYYTVYAAHYVESARIVTDARAEFVLLCVAAAGMIAHSLHVRSRWLTAFAFGTAYFVFLLTNADIGTLTVCGILAISAAYLVRPLKSPELAAVSLTGFYLNYFPVFRDILAARGDPATAPDFWYSLAVVTAVQAVLLWRTPLKKESEGGSRALDVCLSLSAVLYAVTTFSQVTAFAPDHATPALLTIAGVLAALSIMGGRGKESTALSAVTFVLCAGVTYIALVRIVPLPKQFWGFALAASAFGAVGLWLDRRTFATFGFVLAALNLLFYAAHLTEFPPLKTVIGASLFFLGAAGYVLAALSQRSGRGERWLRGAWLYGGMAYILLALATWFEPAPFAVAAISFAIMLDWASEEFAAVPLFQQGFMVAVFIGTYSFVIDYGSNLPVWWEFTPRIIVTVSLTAAFAALAFLRERTPEGNLLDAPHAKLRRILPWLMTSVAAFGVYHEFDPRMRLPVWGLAALALLYLGRRRGEFGADLRAMAYLVTAATAAEGVLSYLLYPGALIGELGWLKGVIYCGSAALLLLPVAWPKWAQDRAEEIEETAAEHLFAILSLALVALFIAKEAHDFYVTLGCSLAGAVYLIAGLCSDKHCMRLPGLGLLGICVLKALFMDLTGLELPYRVLSYIVLGALLVLSSYIYVRVKREEEKSYAS